MDNWSRLWTAICNAEGVVIRITGAPNPPTSQLTRGLDGHTKVVYKQNSSLSGDNTNKNVLQRGPCAEQYNKR